MFPEAPQAASCARCSDAGVLGVVPGIIGCLQALEAIKLAARVHTCLLRARKGCKCARGTTSPNGTDSACLLHALRLPAAALSALQSSLHALAAAGGLSAGPVRQAPGAEPPAGLGMLL